MAYVDPGGYTPPQPPFSGGSRTQAFIWMKIPALSGGGTVDLQNYYWSGPYVYSHSIYQNGNIVNSVLYRTRLDDFNPLVRVTNSVLLNWNYPNNFNDYRGRIRGNNTFKITWNGSQTLPTVPGIYDVVLDYDDGLRAFNGATVGFKVEILPFRQSITGFDVADQDRYYQPGWSGNTFPLTLSATTGLPMTLSVQSGPAIVSGNSGNYSITLTGTGRVTLIATSPGDDIYETTEWTAAFISYQRGYAFGSPDRIPVQNITLRYGWPPFDTSYKSGILLDPAPLTAKFGEDLFLAVRFDLVSSPVSWYRPSGVDGLGIYKGSELFRSSFSDSYSDGFVTPAVDVPFHPPGLSGLVFEAYEYPAVTGEPLLTSSGFLAGEDHHYSSSLFPTWSEPERNPDTNCSYTLTSEVSHILQVYNPDRAESETQLRSYTVSKLIKGACETVPDLYPIPKRDEFTLPLRYYLVHVPVKGGAIKAALQDALVNGKSSIDLRCRLTWKISGEALEDWPAVDFQNSPFFKMTLTQSLTP